MSVGKTLNVCCGMSRVGDVRVDIDPKANRTVEADLFNLPFGYRSFDTVICDPPFSYYSKFKWMTKLADIADRRLLMSSPLLHLRLSRRLWRRTLWYMNDGGFFLRLYWCFDRVNCNLS